MTIEVTQADIDAGVPEDCRACPVALALRRQFKDATVDESHITVNGVDTDAPNAVSAFVASFDDREPVRPFTFKFSPELTP